MDLSLIVGDKSKKWDDFETTKSSLYFDFSSEILEHSQRIKVISQGPSICWGGGRGGDGGVGQHLVPNFDKGISEKNECLEDLKNSWDRFLPGGLTRFFVKKYFIK